MSVIPCIHVMGMPHVLMHWVPSPAHATVDSQEMDYLVKVIALPTFCVVLIPLLDIDECIYNPCHINATCTDTHGSHTCVCNGGFAGDGFTCHQQARTTFPKLRQG